MSVALKLSAGCYEESDAHSESASFAKEKARANLKYFKPSGKTQWLSGNQWPKGPQGEKMRKIATKTKMHGVVILDIKAPHPLAGEQGLFATKPFKLCEIVGEYIGKVGS